MGQMGLLGLTIPEAYMGGWVHLCGLRPGGAVKLSGSVQRLSFDDVRSNPPSSCIPSMPTGTEEQRQKYTALELASGEV